jgi:uncharacterized protein DUF6058
MSRLVPHRPHPVLEGADLRYVLEEFLSLEQLAVREGLDRRRIEGWIEEGALPRPAYVLPDGTAMFPADLLGLVRSAGGVDALPAHFARRTEVAARLMGVGANTRESDWEDYLSGEYGICLRQVTPETLVLKETLVERIGKALETPRPDDPRWRNALVFQVDGLDALIRPFARVDAERFGRQTSRERLVDGPRRQWRWLMETASGETATSAGTGAQPG